MAAGRHKAANKRIPAGPARSISAPSSRRPEGAADLPKQEEERRSRRRLPCQIAPADVRRVHRSSRVEGAGSKSGHQQEE